MAHLRGFLIGIVALLTSSLSAATLTVDLNGGGDSADIQSAIDAAKDGDTVLVKPGEYIIAEPIDFNRLHEPENPASPPVKNITVKSEGGAEVTTIRMSETPTNPDRASVLVFEKGEGPNAKLEGFTVTGGKGLSWGLAGGGGIYCSGSSPTLARCTISGNSAARGGGVYCGFGSSPILKACTISGNLARYEVCDEEEDLCGTYGEGGGICCYGSPATLESCTISGNSATFGGGVYFEGSSPSLTGCTISGNLADGRCWTPPFQGVCFNVDTCLVPCGDGGGVYCGVGSPTLTNCTISSNSATAGGGVCCDLNSSPTLTNCTISGNAARDGGGVMPCEELTLTNCTISGNWALSDGGMYCGQRGAPPHPCSPTLTNCIVWGNAPDSFCGTAFNCLGDRDPLFVQPGAWVDCGSPDDPLCIAYQWSPDTGEPTAWHRWIPGDYHLQAGSPAIDAGTSAGAPTTDFEGHGRPCGAGVDIGAYESGDCQAPTERFRRGDVDSSGAVNITDPIALLNHLFLGGDAPKCLDADDSDDSGTLNITDAIYSLNYLFLGGSAPLAPFPECGIDPTIDGMGCAAYPECP
jgi:hypothetical protein